MVALAPLDALAHDVFLAFGLGFFTAAFFSALRFIGGVSRAACFVQDFLTVSAGFVLYFALSVQVFATGTVRWYTAAAVIGGHLLCCALWRPLVSAWHGRLCRMAGAPWRAVKRVLHRFLHRAKANPHKNNVFFHKNQHNRLPKVYKVLYNSMCEAQSASLSLSNEDKQCKR